MCIRDRVKTGYNPTRLKDEGVQVFTIKAELHEVGLTTAQTPFGHDVPVYDMEPVSYTHLDVYKRQDLDASEIEVRLGATWIDKEYIQQFMYELSLIHI